MPVREVRQLGTAGVRTRTSIDITSMKRDRALHGLSSSGSLQLATGALSSLPLKRIKISFPASLFPYLSVSLSLSRALYLFLFLFLAYSSFHVQIRRNNRALEAITKRTIHFRYVTRSREVAATHRPMEMIISGSARHTTLTRYSSRRPKPGNCICFNIR